MLNLCTSLRLRQQCRRLLQADALLLPRFKTFCTIPYRYIALAETLFVLRARPTILTAPLPISLSIIWRCRHATLCIPLHATTITIIDQDLQGLTRPQETATTHTWLIKKPVGVVCDSPILHTPYHTYHTLFKCTDSVLWIRVLREWELVYLHLSHNCSYSCMY